jgi:hypothetical protein
MLVSWYLMEMKMKKWSCFLLVPIMLSAAGLALAEDRAVDISIGSVGGSLDEAALRTVREVVGHAIARGTVDTFIVYSPRIGSLVPIEGGLSACAEAGFATTKRELNAFIKQLLSIQPDPGTFYNVQTREICNNDENVFCTMDAKLCPDGSSVGRIPPSCEFAPCPGK